MTEGRRSRPYRALIWNHLTLELSLGPLLLLHHCLVSPEPTDEHRRERSAGAQVVIHTSNFSSSPTHHQAHLVYTTLQHARAARKYYAIRKVNLLLDSSVHLRRT